jgi:3-methyl-2-oxobutanoate hydroxymethyltransferase
MRTSIQDLMNMKARGKRIAMLTAYDYPSARLAERAGVRLILVGDSLGMVVHGHDTTLPVTMDDVTRHAAAVVRGTMDALVVGDLPFMSCAIEDDGVRNAARLMQEASVHAVKLEGGRHMVPLVRRLVQLGIPVMGHLGYTPQSTHQIGVRVQAKTGDAAATLIEDALALQEAGAFAIALELVPAELAAAVSKKLQVPTIGIGAGAGCDGQVQVWHDVLGLTVAKPPRHAKIYADVGAVIEKALQTYVTEVENGTFPTAAQSASMAEDELAEALRMAASA